MKQNEILKCEACGLVLETVTECGCGSGCEAQCCGKPMKKLEAKTADFKTEKHVPIVAEKQPEEGLRIVVGSTEHPMTEEHYIEWIEIVSGSCVLRKYLKPGEAPEAVFPVQLKKGMLIREYCNLHGLWSNEIK